MPLSNLECLLRLRLQACDLSGGMLLVMLLSMMYSTSLPNRLMKGIHLFHGAALCPLPSAHIIVTVIIKLVDLLVVQLMAYVPALLLTPLYTVPARFAVAVLSVF